MALDERVPDRGLGRPNARRANAELLRPERGSCDAAPKVSCAPQVGDLREKVGGGAPVGRRPNLHNKIPNAENPEAGWHFC